MAKQSMTRDQKIQLLEDLETKSKLEQTRALKDYNNPNSRALKFAAKRLGKTPEQMVHNIQMDFHRDNSHLRLFLGGNRCLAKGTRITCPNGRHIPIEALKKGDVVLAVDPDTLETLPCPVEEVFYNGIQDVKLYTNVYADGSISRELYATNNHHILTPRGLTEAGYLRSGDEISDPANVFYAGSDGLLLYIAGFIVPHLRFENNRPIAILNKKHYLEVKRLIYHTNAKGFAKVEDSGKVRLFGDIARFLCQYARNKDKLYRYILANYNNKGIGNFLEGFLTHKYMLKGGLVSFYCVGKTEARFLSKALGSLGIVTSNPSQYKASKDRRGRITSIKSPHHVQKLLDTLDLKFLRKQLQRWINERVDSAGYADTPWVKQANFTRFVPDTRESKEEETYDLKLAGGHNLYIANGFIVGNSGKTEAGAVETIWFATGTHPYLKNIPVPNTGRILEESLTHFQNDIIPKFERWAPNYDKWKPIKEQGKIRGFFLPNGSKIEVFTFDQDSNKLEGSNFFYTWANEPPPQKHVEACLRGLIDLEGYLWFTLTPLSEPYLYNEYYLPAVTNERSDIGIHQASMHCNPWLTDKGKKLLLNQISDEERLAREKGEFRHLVGRVFKTFDPLIHVISDGSWPPSWPVTVGIDPHLRKDQIAVFLGHSRKGHYVVLDEIATNGDLEEFGWEIVKRIRDRGYKVQKIMADSMINQPDKRLPIKHALEPKKILDEIFSSSELPLVSIADKKKTKEGFISEVQRLLKIQERPELGMNPETGTSYKGPNLYLMTRCRGTKRDFLNYVYRENRRPELQGVSEEPIKKWDDYLDALKYAFLADPRIRQAFKNRWRPSFDTYGIKGKKSGK